MALSVSALLGDELSLEGGEEDCGALEGVEGELGGVEGVLGGVEGVLGGGVGGCGVVGLLALGQPLSSRQAVINPSTPGSEQDSKKNSLCWNSIGFHNFFSRSWFPILKAGAEFRFS